MDEPRRVMDIMIPPDSYPRLRQDINLAQAWSNMTSFYKELDETPPAEERIALVHHEDGRLAGVITQKAIMTTIIPEVPESVGRLLGGYLEEGWGFFSYLLNPNLKVSDFMTPAEKVAVKSTDVIYKEMQIMLNNNISAFPVVNVWGKVIGVLRRGDVLHSLRLNSAFHKIGFLGCNWDHYGVFGK
ncbi:MAG: HPP family protein [Bacillota bacterium]